MTARRLIYRYVFVPLFLFATIANLWQFVDTTYAAQSTTTLRPNSTITGGWPTVAGTPGGTCSGHCDYVDEVPSGGNGDGNGSYVQTAAIQTEEYGMQDITGGERATNVRVRAYNTRSATGLGGGNLQVNLRVNGTLQTVATQTWGGTNGTYLWFEADFAGTWTQSDIDSAQVWVSKTVGSFGSTYRLSTVEAVVTWESPNFDQNASRTYLNQNNVQPSTPLAATNTVAEVAQSTAFRIRMGVQGSYYNWLSGSWGAHSNQYKLQYAQKSAGSCSAQASGWGDVTGATPIRYFNNATPADGAAISSNVNDPDTGGSTKIYQSYEEANPFTLTNTVNTGETAIWDFSLENTGITPGIAYCLRIIQNDGTALTSYTAASYPEVLITGDYSLAIVDGSGVEVTTPTVVFPTGIVSNTQCASSSATLGTSTQKIRITNDLLTNGWNATIAATDGATAKWTAGSRFYDFNDPTGSPAGCGDGGDGDAYSGQLTVTPSSATITPEAGCSNTGVTTGSAASFNEGTTDAITLISASSGSTRFCYWDVTGIPLGQYIPMSTPAGTYSLDMTITVMNGA